MNKYFLLVLTICIINCSPSKQTVSNGSGDCSVEAKVFDYTGLDGCRFLLELKDGTRLLPISLPDNDFLFSESQIVKINYTLKKDLMSACITAALPVEITCLKEVKPGTKEGQTFFKKECIDTDTPLAYAWVKKMVMRNKISEIKRAYKESKAFYIMYGNVNVHVFDCYGEMICEYPLNENGSSCANKTAQYSNLTSVWALK